MSGAVINSHFHYWFVFLAKEILTFEMFWVVFFLCNNQNNQLIVSPFSSTKSTCLEALRRKNNKKPCASRPDTVWCNTNWSPVSTPLLHSSLSCVNHLTHIQSEPFICRQRLGYIWTLMSAADGDVSSPLPQYTKKKHRVRNWTSVGSV